MAECHSEADLHSEMLGQPKNITEKEVQPCLRKERKWNSRKCSVKTTEGRNRRQRQKPAARTASREVSNMVNINPLR